MYTCKNCGKKYDPFIEECEFMNNTKLLAYDHVKGHLCAECAVKAIAFYEEGIYFETCECCGQRFDLAKESSYYDGYYEGENGIVLQDVWEESGEILCGQCALDWEAAERADRSEEN